MLDAQNLQRYFGGVKAVDGVSISVGDKEIVGLIGPNGSGKSTLVALLTGYNRPQSGSIIFQGNDVTALAPYRRAKLGMARTFQETRLFTELTARENVELAATERLGRGAAASSLADDCLGFTGLERHEQDTRASRLTHAEQRLLMISVALACEPSLVLFDEPAVGMAGRELERITTVIENIPDERGSAVLLIDHNMKLVMGVCQRLVVLDFGRVIANGTPRSVREDAEVIKAYFGESED